jgi:O-antigen ligase
VKWIFLGILLLSIPAAISWLRTGPKLAPWFWSLLTFIPFVLSPWHLIVSPYATPMWSGYVKGWQFTVIDAVAIAILFGHRGRWQRGYMIAPILFYLFAVAVSITQARFGTLASSYLIQLVRAFLVFLAVGRVAQSVEGERALLRGLVFGLCVQFVYALIAKAGGALQTGGSIGHQNLLGFVSHFALLPCLAVLLSGRWTKMALIGVITGGALVVLTASRATIAFSAVGVAVTMLLCMALRFSTRKLAMGVAAFVVVLAMIPIASATLERRFAAQNTSFFQEDLEREAFARAAEDMITTNPLGVGANHYVFIANTEGYSERAGVTWASGARSTNVHNSYLLIAAESGYLGLFSFVIMLMAAMVYAFGSAVRFRRVEGSEIMVGLGAAVFAASLHAGYEWMYVVFTSQYLLAATFGLIAGLRSRYVSEEAQRLKKRRLRTAPAMVSFPPPVPAR